MMLSSDIFPFFPTNPLKRIPQTITNMNKYRAKLEDTTPNVCYLDSICLETDLFPYTSWANKCQGKILKISLLPS